MVNLNVSLKGTNLNHNFYIVSNMNRTGLINKKGARMYNDLGRLRVNNTYLPLIRDIHIASTVRLKSTLVI